MEQELAKANRAYTEAALARTKAEQAYAKAARARDEANRAYVEARGRTIMDQPEIGTLVDMDRALDEANRACVEAYIKANLANLACADACDELIRHRRDQSMEGPS